MLSKIRLKNIQSNVDVTYEFSEGLNIIKAENNTGKSVLIKAINLLAKGHKMKTEERAQYITFGNDKGEIYVHANGFIHYIEIYPNVSNFYYGKFLNGLEFMGNQIPKELIEALSLIICSDDLIGNIIDENQSKFLVESDSKINNAVLGVVTKCDDSEKLIEVLTERVKELTNDIRLAERDKQFAESELEVLEYQNIDDIIVQHRKNNVAIILMDKLVTIHEKLNTLQEIKSVPNNFSELIDLCNRLEGISRKLDNVVDYEYKEFDSSLVESSLSFVNKLNNISSSLDRITICEDMKYSLEDVKFVNDLIDISNRLDNIDYVKVPSEKDIKGLEYLRKISDSINKLDSLARNIIEDEIAITNIKDELDNLEGEVYDCPIHGTIKFVDEKCVPYYNRLTP